ncbi:Ocular albinism type 1 protein [Nesidiocoris tenuis]|uniref:Ocular albinism type 1 protein n=1 Tax=Nesidiocoris tenuis TaxID=355587 RepID=A0ABN7AUR3_9HEMI|nr:Ocular albinism type 1 protein [Nesidiocoris tenuis]
MSDPSIQTFCCHLPGKKNPSISIMSEFNSSGFNTVTLISSLLGCAGAIYQLLPREETLGSRRWFSLTSVRGRQIVKWLALADFMASLGVFLRSLVKIDDYYETTVDEDDTIILCIILAAWIQYFYVVTWAWNLFYAIDTYLAIKKKPGYPKLYHSLAWTVPAALSSIGLAVLYIPDADCHNVGMDTTATYLRLLPNFILTYAAICCVMIACPVIYFITMREVDHIVTSSMGQVTSKERAVIQAVQLRFGLIILAFWLCWLPNLVNGIVVWVSWFDLPRRFVLILWYTMAVLNPLQAFFDSLVYRRANMKIVNPFASRALSVKPTERTPLVQSPVNS